MGVTRAMMNDTHQENVELRAKLQAAESALKLVIRELDYLLATPITAGDIHYARGVLAKARVVLERGADLPGDQGTPICTRCHLPMVVPQTLDYVGSESNRECMSCVAKWYLRQ